MNKDSKLIDLYDIEDEKYGTIHVCLNESDEKTFIINNQIVTDEDVINDIKKRNNLYVPKNLQGIIYKKN